MLPYRDSKLMRLVLIAFFLLVIGYGFFEARGMLFGPRIELPDETIQSSEQFITIRGKAQHIAQLRMNGTSISVTEDGSFAEPYLLSPGLNRIVFDAEDKYGGKRQEVVQIVYTPQPGQMPAQEGSTTTEDVWPPMAPQNP